MIQGGINELKNGTKLYQERARQALPILVRQAQAGKPITYSNLAQEMGMSNPRNLNFVLGCIGFALEELSKTPFGETPLINILAVNAYTGLPGEGVFELLKKKFIVISKEERNAAVKFVNQTIYDFPRWKDVLDYFGLQPLPPLDYSAQLAMNKGRKYGAGESPAHKKFKEFICSNPQILGLPKRLGRGETEFEFPSKDAVDIRFVLGNEWIAVEVKAIISDFDDIRRGIYQCVKYQALIKAFQAEQGLQPNCRAVLVLEGKLPEPLIPLRNLLGVEVIDNVSQRYGVISNRTII